MHTQEAALIDVRMRFARAGIERRIAEHHRRYAQERQQRLVFGVLVWMRRLKKKQSEA